MYTIYIWVWRFLWNLTKNIKHFPLHRPLWFHDIFYHQIPFKGKLKQNAQIPWKTFKTDVEWISEMSINCLKHSSVLKNVITLFLWILYHRYHILNLIKFFSVISGVLKIPFFTFTVSNTTIFSRTAQNIWGKSVKFHRRRV